MIQQESKVIVADNTWAKVAKVIRVLKGSRARFARIGDRVVVAIKTATASGQIDKWSVQRWVVVRVVKEIVRKDWTYIRFWDNAIALISKTWDPLGKRIFGPVAKEVREKGFKSLATMAEEIV
jgi:large subunit ribosomal protein L14